jgi:Holliday junction resolvase
MSMPRHKAKRDAAEPEIVSTLQQCGFSVVRMDKPVDLLVGFRGRAWLIECKSGDKGYAKALNKNQKDFDSAWRGPRVVILRSAQDAMDWAVSVASATGRAA